MENIIFNYNLRIIIFEKLQQDNPLKYKKHN